MLSEEGRAVVNLLKPWISIPNFLVLLAVVFAISLLDLNSTEWAGFAQAFGSIAALAIAIGVARYQGKQTLRVAENQARDSARLARRQAENEYKRLLANGRKLDVERKTRVRNFAQYVLAYVEHAESYRTRPSEVESHEAQISNLQSVLNSLMLDEGDLSRQLILLELGRILYDVRRCYAPGRFEVNSIHHKLSGIIGRLNT
jgi:hypothetical protein